MTALGLSAAELSLVRAMLTGRRRKEIAEATSRSVKTLEYQARCIRLKLGIRNDAQLGAWAERNGIRAEVVW